MLLPTTVLAEAGVSLSLPRLEPAAFMAGEIAVEVRDGRREATLGDNVIGADEGINVGLLIMTGIVKKEVDVVVLEDRALTQLISGLVVSTIKTHIKSGVGVSMLVTAGVFATGGLIVGFTSQAQGRGTGGAPYLIGAAIPLSIIGAIFAARGARDRKRLVSYDLHWILDRREAWEAVQAHNGLLRREQGLPDDERLDGPDAAGD